MTNYNDFKARYNRILENLNIDPYAWFDYRGLIEEMIETIEELAISNKETIKKMLV